MALCKGFDSRRTPKTLNLKFVHHRLNSHMSDVSASCSHASDAVFIDEFYWILTSSVVFSHNGNFGVDYATDVFGCLVMPKSHLGIPVDFNA